MEREFSKPTSLQLANPAWKRWIRRLIVFSVLLAVSGAAYLAGEPQYRAFKIRWMQRSAAEFASGGQIDRADGALRSAHALDPSDKSTLRLLAALWEGRDQRQELLWRSRLDALTPGDRKNLMAIARLGLAIGELGPADQALAGLARDPKSESAALWNLQALRAATRGDWRTACDLARKACEAAPEIAEHRLNFARFATASGRADDLEKSDELLYALARDPASRPEALRIRRDRSEKLGDYPSALAHSASLLALDAAASADRIRHLTLMDVSQDPAAGRWLATLMEHARNDMRLMTGLLEWLDSRGRHQEIIDWITGLSEEIAMPVQGRVALASALDTTRNWQAIIDRFEADPWPEEDFLRSALLAKARRALAPANLSAWQTPWKRAVQEALADGRQSLLFASRCLGWDEWQDECGELLREIYKRHPDQTLQSLSLLTDLARRQGRTRGLLEAAELIAAAKPGDDKALNNAVYYSLLLRSKPQATRRSLDGLAARNPDDPAILATRALALHLDGRNAEAQALLEKAHINPGNPAVDALRSALLHQLGRSAEAGSLAATIDQSKLLPEEKALLSF